jgi:hypothetical protein
LLQVLFAVGAGVALDEILELWQLHLMVVEGRGVGRFLGERVSGWRRSVARRER